MCITVSIYTGVLVASNECQNKSSTTICPLSNTREIYNYYNRLTMLSRDSINDACEIVWARVTTESSKEFEMRELSEVMGWRGVGLQGARVNEVRMRESRDE